MNKKLAIFGFTIIWIVSIVAILFVLLPKLLAQKAVFTKIQNEEENTEFKIDKSNQDDDSFFYEKKAFAHHKKNATDSTDEDEKTIFVRKSIFFKPPSLKIKPVIIATPNKKDNSKFDIKLVPTS